MVYISSRKEDELVEQYGVSYDVIDSYKKYLGRLHNKNFNAERGRAAFSDSTKQKTYDAENLLRAMRGTMGPIDQEKADRVARDIFESPEWQKYGNLNSASKVVPPITFRRMRMRGLAYYSRITINPDCGATMHTLLHELAHTAGHRHHDIGFRICLVAFMKRYDPAHGALLERIYKDRGLKMRVPKVKEPQDFGTWLKKYQHMQMVRANRPTK